MIRRLCIIFGCKHKTQTISYLAKILSEGNRKFYYNEYLQYINNKINHNTIRSWSRIISSISKYVPDIIDNIESENYILLNEKSDCLYDMLQGNRCRYDLINRILYNKSYIINNMMNLFNISESGAYQLYNCMYKSNTLPESVLSKISSRFPNSVNNDYLTDNFIYSLKYYYSY